MRTRILGIGVAVVAIAAGAFGQANEKVLVNFKAVVGDRAFDCRESYEGIGTTKSKMTVSDFRIYIQDVRLVDKKGKEIALKLTADGNYQTDKVALLDFENGEGNCASGTKALNTAIVGEVPKGKYVGLKFRIGVPEELNHLDPASQPSPLNISRMMWSWQMGYKFARIDTRTSGRPNGYVLHLGSTKCATDSATNITTCGSPNRPEFVFDKFNVADDVVAVDLGALFAGANVDVNQANTAAGCMSFEGDGDCLPVFRSLGLSFEGSETAKQTFMRVESAKSAGVRSTKGGR